MPSSTGISNHGRQNVFENIHEGRNQYETHYGRAGGYEDFLWTSAAYVRLFLEFLDSSRPADASSGMPDTSPCSSPKAT